MNITANLRVMFSGFAVSDAGRKQEYFNIIKALANGVGVDQVDQLYAAQRTVASSGTPDSIDLNGGSLIGSDGTAFSMVELVLGIFVNKSSVETLTFGGGSTPFSSAFSTIILPPSPVPTTNPSFNLFYCPAAAAFAIGAGASDLLRVSTGAGTNVPYIVYLAGRSA